jgi:hypothetical protein
MCDRLDEPSFPQRPRKSAVGMARSMSRKIRYVFPLHCRTFGSPRLEHITYVDDDGCGCRVAGQAADVPWFLFGSVGLAVCIRRR